MTFSVLSNNSVQNSEHVNNNLKERVPKDVPVQKTKTKGEIIYERYIQIKLEAQEKYDRMTPIEQREADMQQSI